jgi:hypothetical protein
MNKKIISQDNLNGRKEQLEKDRTYMEPSGYYKEKYLLDKLQEKLNETP